MSGRQSRQVGGDQGSVLVLMTGLVVVLLGLVAVVVDVSALVLARRAVSSAADGAAVSGAQGLDYATFYAHGPGKGVPLSEAAVAERVAVYEQGAAPDQPGLELSGEVEGGYTAVVTASRTVRLPLGAWLDVTEVQVRAVARARAPLVGP